MIKVILQGLLIFGLPVAIIAAIFGALLPRSIAVVLSILVAAITPPLASVLSWPPDPRNRIFTMAWFSQEAVGFLAIPWFLCLISAVIGIAVGRRFYQKKRRELRVDR
jgi:hypothetical protein